MAPNTKLFLAATVVLLATLAAAQDFVATTNSSTQARVVVTNRRPDLKIYPSSTSNSFIQVRFGRVAELDANGRPVPSHNLAALADVSTAPTFTSGNLTLNSTTVYYTRLQISLSSLGSAFVSACGVASLAAANSGFVAVTAYYNIASNVSFPYGAGNSVLVLANSMKFNIEAQNWPFCSTSNSLLMELVIRTSRENASYPYLLGETAVEATAYSNSSASVVSASRRKLLQGSASAVAVNGNANAVSSTSTSAGASGSVTTTSSSSSGSSGSSTSSSTTVSAGASVKPRPVFQGGEQPKVPPGQAKRMKDERCKMAKLLVSADAAASLNLQTYATNSDSGTVRYNVTVAMAVGGPQGESNKATRVLLNFPYFANSLYYDPAVEFESAAAAGYDASAVAASDKPSGAASATASVLLLLLSALAAMLVL